MLSSSVEVIDVGVPRGRGVFVRPGKEVVLGELVLADRGLACVRPAVLAGVERELCWHCLARRAVPLKRCTGCSRARYCDARCHRRSWQSGHKRECRVLERHDVPAPLLPLLRLALQGGEEWSEALELEGAGSRRASGSESIAEGAAAAAGLVGGEVSGAVRWLHGVMPAGVAYSATELWFMMLRLRRNNFSVVNDLYDAIAEGVFCKGAILNHDCAPNCVISYRLDQATGRAVQEVRCIAKCVAAGEELTHSYCDSAWARDQRRDHLRKHYGFFCQCRLCEHAPERNPVEAIKLRIMQSQLACGDPESEPSTLKDLHLDLDDEDLDIALLAHVGDALTLALEEADWPTAEKCSLQIIRMYEVLYSHFHPLIGLQLFTLGDVQGMLGHDAAAQASHKRALEVLLVTNGPQSPLVKRLLDQDIDLN